MISDFSFLYLEIESDDMVNLATVGGNTALNVTVFTGEKSHSLLSFKRSNVQNDDGHICQAKRPDLPTTLSNIVIYKTIVSSKRLSVIRLNQNHCQFVIPGPTCSIFTTENALKIL